MIKHIVMFRVKDTFNITEREEALVAIKNQLDLLPSKINEIRHFETGINIKESPSAFDIILVSEFDNPDDLEAYRVHPAHQKFIEFNSTYKKESAVVDFVM